MAEICAILLRRLIDLGCLFILISFIMIVNYFWRKCHDKSLEVDDSIEMVENAEFIDISL
jgi:hypothetical protein